MVSDILMENELTKNNSDFTEWYAVLCQYAKTRGVVTVTDDAWRDSYADGLTPAKALDSVLYKLSSR